MRGDLYDLTYNIYNFNDSYIWRASGTWNHAGMEHTTFDSGNRILSDHFDNPGHLRTPDHCIPDTYRSWNYSSYR